MSTTRHYTFGLSFATDRSSPEEAARAVAATVVAMGAAKVASGIDGIVSVGNDKVLGDVEPID